MTRDSGDTDHEAAITPPCAESPPHRCPSCAYPLSIPPDSIVRCPECGLRCRASSGRPVAALYHDLVPVAMIGAVVSTPALVVGLIAAWRGDANVFRIALLVTVMALGVTAWCMRRRVPVPSGLIAATILTAHWTVVVIPASLFIIFTALVVAPYLSLLLLVAVPFLALRLTRHFDRALRVASDRIATRWHDEREAGANE